MPRYAITSTRFSFTDKAIRELPPHDPSSRSAQTEYCDANCVGLRIFVTKLGHKYWGFRYRWRGRKHIRWIGEVTPVLNLKQARQQVWEMKLMMSRGENPAEWKARQDRIPTFRRFVEDQYLPYCRATISRPDVVESRLNTGALPYFGDRTIDSISRADVQRFHASIRERLSISTANHHLTCLKRIFNLAVQWEVVAKSPAAGVKKFPQPAGRDRYLNRAELKRFREALDQCPNIITATALRFLLFSGLRSGEALALAWSDVDPEQRSVVLRHTKAGRSRRVYLSDHAWGEIERMESVRQSDNPYVFPGRKKSEHLVSLRETFQAVLKKAQITDFKVHDLRHTVASYLVQSGATLFEVQRILGHTTPAMTQRYAHLSDRALRDCVQLAVDSFALRPALAAECEAGSSTGEESDSSLLSADLAR